MGEQNSGGVILFFLIALVVHGFDVYLRLGTSKITWLHPIAIFYVFLIALAYIFLDKQKIRTYVVVSFLAYCIPFANYLTYWTRDLGGFGTFLETLVAAVIIFAPVWIIYLMFSQDASSTLQKLGAIYLIIWLIAFTPAAYQELSPKFSDSKFSVPGILPGLTIAQAINYIARGITTTITGAQKVIPWTREQMKAQIEYAQTGVDPRKRAKMEAINNRNPGVMIENIKTAEPVFYTDSPTVVYATFKADTVDAPFDANLECYASSVPIPASRIEPAKRFHIESYTEQEVDCIFNAETLPKGTHTVHLLADFEFKTMAQIETFVMEDERLRKMKSAKENPLAGYPQPETLTTKGPINLNIQMPAAPIGIAPGKKISFTINALNEWRGRIVEVKNLIIYIPKGIALESITGRKVEQISCEVVSAEEKENCDDTKLNVYALAQEELQKKSYKNITAAFAFRAYARVDDYKEVLGESPINAQSFGASLEYDYEIEKTIQIKVKEAEKIIPII